MFFTPYKLFCLEIVGEYGMLDHDIVLDDVGTCPIYDGVPECMGRIGIFVMASYQLEFDSMVVGQSQNT